MEKDQKKSQGTQKDDALWMYRSNLVKGKEQMRKDYQAAAAKPVQKSNYAKGIDQTVEKTELYCNQLNSKTNPNASV